MASRSSLLRILIPLAALLLFNTIESSSGTLEPEINTQGLSAITTSRVSLNQLQGVVNATSGQFVQMKCHWDDTSGGAISQPRSFDAYLWAPSGQAAKAVVPAQGNSPELGMELESGLLLLQGVTGTRPRSKAGGGRATGNGTTIVLWADTSNPAAPVYRAACLGGVCQVDELRQRLGNGTLQNLAGQPVKAGFYVEWDKDRVTATTGDPNHPTPLLRAISQNSKFTSLINDLLQQTRVTPD